MRLRILAGLALVLILPAADDPSTEPRMVDLNVVAVDQHGNPVSDLTRDEFHVTDSGKPQTIAFFRRRESHTGAAPKLAANEFSNRNQANIPRATLILFDMMNLDFSTRGVSANSLERALASLENPDYVYLYFLTVNGRLYAVHGLPGPEGETRLPGGAPWTSQIKPLMEQALRAVQDFRTPDEDVAVRVIWTYGALGQIAAELSRVPGRKNIVWVTDGVPIELGPKRSDTDEFVDFTPMLRKLSEGFDRSGVAIYPVRQNMLGSRNVDGATSGVLSISTLDQFAEMTGGRPDAGKDIGMALRQAISDTRTSYQIGYYPPPNNWDDKYHKLRITCTRKGVRIQAKTAYYAWREAPGNLSEQAIASAIGTSFDAAEIGIRATLSAGPNSSAMHLNACIDAQDIVLTRAGELYDGELRLAVVTYTPGEPPHQDPEIPLNLHFSAEARDQALAQGIGFDHELSGADHPQYVRLIVYDRGSHAIGSLTMPVPVAAEQQPAAQH